MRLQLTLEYRPGSRLPAHHAWLFNSAIYRKLREADPVFADWLHERGFDATNRSFKLFNFSPLQTPTGLRTDWKTGFCLLGNSGRAVWQAAFHVEKALENYIVGLFRDPHIGIGDGSLAPVDFFVRNVEVLPRPDFDADFAPVALRAVSPICISRKTPADAHEQYLPPDDPDFAPFLFENLRQKWVNAHRLAPETDRERVGECRLRVLNEVRRRLWTVKNGRGAEATNVVGFAFDFEVFCPAAWLEAGWFGGFGRRGSEGFGWCEKVLNN